VRELAEETEKTLHRSIVSASHFLDDIINGRGDIKSMHDSAMAEHGEAWDNVEALARAIRDGRS
jgi:hypothetical protein